MLKRIAFIGLSLLITTSFAQAPDTMWTCNYGTLNDDRSYYGHQTSDGGYIIYGTTTPGSTNDMDIYIVKTDSLGGIMWTKTYGKDSSDVARRGQQTTDGGYIVTGNTDMVGYGFTRAYLLKMNSAGDTLWMKTYADTSAGYFVQQTVDGGYIMSGSVCPGYTQQIYLVKTNSIGDTVWTKIYGGSGEDWSWEVKQTSDSGYIVVGTTTSYGSGLYEIYLLKTDLYGDSLWARAYGGSNNEQGLSVCQTSDGGYAIAGFTQSFGAGSWDVWIIRTDSIGDTLWTRTYGGPQIDAARCINVVPSGGFIVSGYTDSFGAGDRDFYVIRINDNGQPFWTATYGMSDWDYGGSICVTSDNGYAAFGYTNSYSAVGLDFWLVKIKPDTCGISEQSIKLEKYQYTGPTILTGPLLLPGGIDCRVFDITGRMVVPEKMKPGVYFVEVDGVITQKVVKIR